MTVPHNSDTAFTGLEAALVLIAFVVVASVFAYTMLGAGFSTTQKSQEVIHTGVVGASSTVQLTGEVYGIGEEGVSVNMINFSVSLAPGGSAIDFDKVSITYSNETNLEPLVPVDGIQSYSTEPGTWAVIGVTGESGTTNNLLEKGEQFQLSVHPVSGTPRSTELSVQVKPGVGSTITIKRSVPAAVRIVNQLY
jgi:flagellin FlaB